MKTNKTPKAKKATFKMGYTEQGKTHKHSKRIQGMIDQEKELRDDRP